MIRRANHAYLKYSIPSAGPKRLLELIVIGQLDINVIYLLPFF